MQSVSQGCSFSSSFEKLWNLMSNSHLPLAKPLSAPDLAIGCNRQWQLCHTPEVIWLLHLDWESNTGSSVCPTLVLFITDEPVDKLNAQLL